MHFILSNTSTNVKLNPMITFEQGNPVPLVICHSLTISYGLLKSILSKNEIPCFREHQLKVTLQPITNAHNWSEKASIRVVKNRGNLN